MSEAVRYDVCENCGLRYQDMKTGLTFADVYMFLWSWDGDPSTWRQKSRGVVLGKWHEIKLEMWSSHIEKCYALSSK